MNEADWDREEGEKRSVGERHRRSEGGLSVLFARRAVIDIRNPAEPAVELMQKSMNQ